MGLFPKDRDLTRPLEELELKVDASFFRTKVGELSVRLDQFLGAHLTWRSRTSIQTLVRDGYVLVDPSTPDHPDGTGERAVERRPGRKLRHGSVVVVVIPEEYRIPEPVGPASRIDILYEDAEVVAVDKPPLVAVHPSGRHMSDTLIQRVHAHYSEEVEAGQMVPRLCHRLDRETSGIVLVGKNPKTHADVMRQFEDRLVSKEYLAVVWGELEEDAGTIRYPLAPARASRIALKMTVAEDGLESRTDWAAVERYEGYTLVRCELHTGRQHQIRVHLAAIGHAIVGDKLYGPDDELFTRSLDVGLGAEDLWRLELERQALHNHRLVFTTPDGGRRVEVESPLAGDLRAFLDDKEPVA